MQKNILSIGIILLFIVSALVPITIGNNTSLSTDNDDDSLFLSNLAFMCITPDGLDVEKYNLYKENWLRQQSEDNSELEYESGKYFKQDSKETLISNNKHSNILTISPPIDSPWPMKCHDIRHTSLSPYSTADNPYDEMWKFKADRIEGGPVIDKDGIIYFGDFDSDLYAIYPNGTQKWKYRVDGWIWSVPAIGDDGTIYVGTFQGSGLHAINPDGTKKWRIGLGGSIASSPAIGEDGIIYVGTLSSGNSIVAVNPNGTIKWQYKTGYHVTSDPVIDDDGIIYCGSADTYIYALYPNGTLKWRFKTGDIIKAHPSIANDGTVYIGSWDDYLYAVYPNNGTLKWKSKIGQGTETNPSIGPDGTIYIGSYDGHLYATYPNGTRKWSFSTSGFGNIHQSSPAICSDGIIYFGTDDAGYIVAVNPDGTERWKKDLAKDWVESSPCIGEGGIVYIGSTYQLASETGYLHAFGRAELSADTDGPYYGLTNQPLQFTGSGYGGYKPYTYLWDFGDSNTSNQQNPVYEYTTAGDYIVIFTVTDDTGNSTYDTTSAWIQETNNPPTTPDIDGPNSGKVETSYTYEISSTDPDGTDMIWYYVDWDDGTVTDWTGPYSSGQIVEKSHKWSSKRVYNIRVKAKDIYDDESDWGILAVEIPRNRMINFQSIIDLLNQIPIIREVFLRLLNH
jgi:outer membrane protein assembly factor BamB